MLKNFQFNIKVMLDDNFTHIFYPKEFEFERRNPILKMIKERNTEKVISSFPYPKPSEKNSKEPLSPLE